MATRRITLIGFLSTLFAKFIPAIASEATSSEASEEDGGFIDLDLTLAAIQRHENGIVSVVARTKLDGTDVGFQVDLMPEWKATPITEGADAHFYWGAAVWRSIGHESDRFIASLAKLYRVASPASLMQQQINIQVVGLATDPSAVMTQLTKMKLFFDDGEAEVYLNVDARDRRVEFHEKDPEYRIPLIRALTTNR